MLSRDVIQHTSVIIRCNLLLTTAIREWHLKTPHSSGVEERARDTWFWIQTPPRHWLSPLTLVGLGFTTWTLCVFLQLGGKVVNTMNRHGEELAISLFTRSISVVAVRFFCCCWYESGSWLNSVLSLSVVYYLMYTTTVYVGFLSAIAVVLSHAQFRTSIGLLICTSN